MPWFGNIMSAFVFTLLGLTVGSSYPCAVRREIAPCTCRLQEPKLTTIVVACEKMRSFNNIIEVLHNRFPIEQDISLKVSYSDFDDLSEKSFKDLGMSISNLNLNFDGLSYLPDTSFSGLENVEYLSLADNRLVEIPRKVLRKMPKLKTLDLGRSRITNILNEDFQDLPMLQHVLLPGNSLVKIEPKAIPRSVRRIHLGRNYLAHLNGSLRNLTDMEWIFINGNELVTLDDQLPIQAPKLTLIHAANNLLTSLPIELINYPNMDSLFFSNNEISSLNGALQKSRRLKRLHLTYNKIHTLADYEFAASEAMDDIQLGHNHLHTLNKAFSPLKRLRTLNLTHNHLIEFCLQEVRGLQNLKVVDLSHNRITTLSGRMENLVELETRIEELHLEFNEISALKGSLMGVHGLQRLILHNNKLLNIAPDDLIGLEDLTLLDISYNYLKTLEETSKTFLPKLQDLIATNNLLTTLEKDFHGLPVLCRADLSRNQISNINRELASKTRCRGTGGILMVALHENPILCLDEFNKTAEHMMANFTLLQGDFSICPPPLTTTTTPETIPSVPPVTETDSITTTTTELISIVLAPPLPQVIPLSYNPEEQFEQKTQVTKQIEVIIPMSTPFNQSVTIAPSTTISPPSHSPQIGPSLILKNEGENLTLVIPVKADILHKDQYVQKSDELLDKNNVTSAITNIEIVEIRSLPEKKPDENLKTLHNGSN